MSVSEPSCRYRVPTTTPEDPQGTPRAHPAGRKTDICIYHVMLGNGNANRYDALPDTSTPSTNLLISFNQRTTEYILFLILNIGTYFP